MEGAPSGGPTILLDLFLTNQHRKQMIEAALAKTDLPPEDYPVYVLVGAEGPWTPTGLAKRLEMPLSTMLFRLGRLEQRGHAERFPNPDDRRSVFLQEGLSEREGLRSEWACSAPVFECEGAAGAARFAQGKGRHGDFGDI